MERANTRPRCGHPVPAGARQASRGRRPRPRFGEAGPAKRGRQGARAHRNCSCRNACRRKTGPVPFRYRAGAPATPSPAETAPMYPGRLGLSTSSACASRGRRTSCAPLDARPLSGRAGFPEPRLYVLSTFRPGALSVPGRSAGNARSRENRPDVSRAIGAFDVVCMRILRSPYVLRPVVGRTSAFRAHRFSRAPPICLVNIQARYPFGTGPFPA